MKTILYYLFIFFFITSLANAQSASERNKAADKKAAAERQRSLGGQRTDNELKDDLHKIQPTNHLKGTPSNNAADTSNTNPTRNEHPTKQEVVPTNKDQGSEANNNTDANTNANAGSSSQNNGASNAAVVIQRTSSEGGSPSVLSRENGKDRDGTNNIQRSTYNMAGAQLSGNWNLDKKNRNGQTINSDSTRIKKQEEQPQREIPRGQNASKQGAKGLAGTKGVTHNKQTAVQKDNNGKDKEAAKSKKKDRKHKGKNSGK
jgi:hypothetical protein